MGGIITLDKQRSERCFAKIVKILQEDNCMIIPKIVIMGQIISEYGWNVVAVPNIPKGLEVTDAGGLFSDKAKDS